MPQRLLPSSNAVAKWMRTNIKSTVMSLRQPRQHLKTLRKRLCFQYAHAGSLRWGALASDFVKGQGPFMAVHPRAYGCQWVSPDVSEHLREHLAGTLILRRGEWHLRLRQTQEAAEYTE